METQGKSKAVALIRHGPLAQPSCAPEEKEIRTSSMLRAEDSIYNCQRVICFFQATDRTWGERLHILLVSKDLVISGDNKGHCSVLLSVMGCSRAVPALWLGGDSRMGEGRTAVAHGPIAGLILFIWLCLDHWLHCHELSHRISRIMAKQKMSSFGRVSQPCATGISVPWTPNAPGMLFMRIRCQHLCLTESSLAAVLYPTVL